MINRMKFKHIYPDTLLIESFDNYKLIFNKNSLEDKESNFVYYTLYRIDNNIRQSYGTSYKRKIKTTEDIKVDAFIFWKDTWTFPLEKQVKNMFHKTKCFICNKKGLFEDMICIDENDDGKGYRPEKRSVHFNCYEKIENNKF